MSYSIQAILAAQGTFAAELANGMEVLQLDGGIEMIALGSTARKLLGLPFLPLTDEGVEELPPALRGLCSALSVHGPVAYVEAEIFGGSGTQAHTLIPAGGGGTDALVSVSNDAINSALEWLGVWPLDGKDRFDTVGLGKHRETDSWVVGTTP